MYKALRIDPRVREIQFGELVVPRNTSLAGGYYFARVDDAGKVVLERNGVETTFSPSNLYNVMVREY